MSAAKHSKPIIALFGGSRDADSEVVACARRLGEVIANKDMVLLTGGNKPKGNAPKNSALEGAGAKPWVAVAQGEDVRGHKYPDKTKLGFTITSDLGDKRNYLEALMCDAAIVLYGGEGTRSELTSTLSLQRPVVLLDSRWHGKHDLDEPARDGTLDELVWRARKLFFNEKNATRNHALDDRLRIAALRAALDRLPPYRYVESTTDEALVDAVQWLAGEIKHLPGHFSKVCRTRGRGGGVCTLAGRRRRLTIIRVASSEPLDADRRP